MAAKITPGRAWGAVILLTVLYAFSMLDRLILSMLVGPIKQDLGIGDFKMGLLMGLAFSLTYVLLGYPAGAYADRYSRPKLIAAGLLVWSLATIACGFATGFAVLFAFRMFVGVGEATLSPSAYSLISDLFPRDRRGLPLSIYQTASPIGSSLAALAGGMMIDWATRSGGSLSLFGGVMAPWQLVFIGVGLPGLVLVFLALLLPEPRVATRDRRAAMQAPPLLPFVRENRTLLTLFFVTFGVTVLVSYAIGSWTPEHMVRTFGWSRARVGAIMAALFLAPPFLSHLVTGVVMDRMAAKGISDAPLRLFRGMAIIALPFGVLAYLTRSPEVCVGSLLMLKLLFIPSLGFSSTALQLFVPEAMRGRLSGAFLSFINLLGVGIGPALVGGLSQYAFRHDGALGTSLMIVVGGGIALVCVLLSATLRPMREAVALSSSSSD